MRSGIVPSAALTFVLAAVGCGARTDGLLDGVEGDSPGDPSGDASRGESGIVGDADRRDGGGARDSATGLDSSIVPDEGVLPDDAFLLESGPVPPPGCPAALPRDGTPCDDEKLVCSYAGCDPTTKDRAECSVGTGGKWSVRAAACATPSDRCPIAEPIDRTPCALSADILCYYSGDCTLQTIAYCYGGSTWAVKHGGCPPPGACPPTLPAVGTDCSKLASTTTCTYDNGCGHHALIICEKESPTRYAWADLFIEPCTAPAPCPSTAPALGSACGKRDVTCAWPNACGSTDLARCSDDRWRFTYGLCADATCPPTPKDGSACTLDGETCTYPIGGGCSLACACTGGAWACKQPPCGADTSGGK